ncbi:MAG: hypothetical protein ACYTFK_07945 [Planctomycetota bacterium]|jgi:hypothetical protein
MVVVMLLIFLAVTVPLLILRPFSINQKMFVLIVILGHLTVMLFLHFLLIRRTGIPVVVDIHQDTRNYYDNTAGFRNSAPFSVSIRDAIGAAEESKHFGYQYLLATLWTITPYAILAMRILKTLLFFVSLACLMRAWYVDYGDRYTMWAFAFMGIVCTPAFFYSYRNLKDSIILALFMFITAILDTLFRPLKNRLYPIRKNTIIIYWCLIFLLLYFISTIRLYVPAIIVAALGMNSIMSSRMDIKKRVFLVFIMGVIGLIAVSSGMGTRVLEMKEEGMETSGGGPDAYLVFRAFISPIPWQCKDPSLIPFHYVYLLMMLYTLYAMFKHFWYNMNWKLFVFVMTMYVAGATGNPMRKRLIIIPIMLSWILTHLVSKHKFQDEFSDYDIGMEYDLYEHSEYENEYVLYQ